MRYKSPAIPAGLLFFPTSPDIYFSLLCGLLVRLPHLRGILMRTCPLLLLLLLLLPSPAPAIAESLVDQPASVEFEFGGYRFGQSPAANMTWM